MGPSSAMAANAAAGAGSVAAAFVCSGACLVALIRIAYAWIAPAEKPGLRFSEAEIAFLFPAPMTRKALIHFRLLSSQLAILFTSALIAVFFNRSSYLGGSRVIQAVGWWVILSTFDLHLNGTNLTLSRLRERSSHFRLWRLAAVAAIVLYAGAVIDAAGFGAQGRRGSAGAAGALDPARGSLRADPGGAPGSRDEGAQGLRLGRLRRRLDMSFGKPSERLRFAVDQEAAGVPRRRAAGDLRHDRRADRRGEGRLFAARRGAEADRHQRGAAAGASGRSAKSSCRRRCPRAARPGRAPTSNSATSSRSCASRRPIRSSAITAVSPKW